MVLAAIIFNAVFAVGVIVAVITPLVWAILTQHHDDPRPTAVEPVTPRVPHTPERSRTRRPQYKPVMGRI